MQQSLPHTPTGMVYWKVYAYDGLGRTKTVTLPDGTYTSYAYAGNTVTITDPKGNSSTNP